MKTYKYLIIGGGMTADAALRGIRELDVAGTIGLISAESDPPYSRPPLSKKLWMGRPMEKIWLGTDKLKADLHLGRRVMNLDLAGKRVRDDKGDEYGYEKLLLATGGSPNRLPFGDNEMIYFRTVQDYHRLRALADRGQKIAVIGAGFIGTELAAVLSAAGKQVSMIFPGASIGENVYPSDVSQFVTETYRKKGVELIAGESVSGVEKAGAKMRVKTKGGKTIEADGVVAGLGIHLNLELAQAAGLKIDNGIVVDDRQRTSAPDIFAAGDVAMFPHASLGKLTRVEHEDHALQMGRQAGRNMAGANEAYTHTPYFYTDMFEIGYEAVGQLNSKLEVVADWQEKFHKGTLYYLDRGRVRGVLLWNVWGQTAEAAALMAQPGPFKAADLIGKIRGD